MENMQTLPAQNFGQPMVQANAAADSQKAAAPMFNPKEFAFMLLFNWYWPIIGAVVAFVIAFIYVRTLQPQYLRVTDIQITSAQANESSPVDIAKYLGFDNGGSKAALDNELYIMHSLTLASHVAKALHLDVLYYKKGMFREIYLYEDRPFEFEFESAFTQRLEIGIRPETMETFHIVSMRVDGVESPIPEQDDFSYYFDSDFELPITHEKAHVRVSDKNYRFLTASLNEIIYVRRVSPSEAAYRCQSMIDTETRASSVIRISCVATSVGEADAVLTEFTKAYNEQSTEKRNASVHTSADFVAQRIEETARELGETSNKLTEYGIDLAADEAKTAMKGTNAGELASARDALAKVQNALANAQSMAQRLQEALATKAYIPPMGAASAAGLDGQIAGYNQLIREREELMSMSSANNPAVLKRDADIESLSRNIMGGVNAYIETLSSEGRLASSRVARLNDAMQTNKPGAGYDTTDIEAKSLTISHKYKEEYFSYLLQKQEELRLQLAVSEDNAKVIEEPMGSTVPIYPVPLKMYLIFTGVGIAIPILIILIVLMMTNTVRGRKDVEDVLTMPFLGEIPAQEKKKGSKGFIAKMLDKMLGIKEERVNRIVVNANTKNTIAEAFHIVQGNLAYVQTTLDGQRPETIFFTSYAPGAGKSFVSQNLASILANTERKCIWVDLDIRKGHKNFNLVREDQRPRRRIGLSSVLAGKAKLEDCIFESADNEKLDLLLAGPVPPNPVQLLMSEKLDEIVELLKQRYEYVILDSVPATVVADAAICNRLADISIYVVRVGVTDRRQLPEIERLYQSQKFKNMCCLLNGAIVTRHGYGGYGYGYGYGYGSEGDKKE